MPWTLVVLMGYFPIEAEDSVEPNPTGTAENVPITPVSSGSEAANLVVTTVAPPIPSPASFSDPVAVSTGQSDNQNPVSQTFSQNASLTSENGPSQQSSSAPVSISSQGVSQPVSNPMPRPSLIPNPMPKNLTPSEALQLKIEAKKLQIKEEETGRSFLKGSPASEKQKLGMISSRMFLLGHYMAIAKEDPTTYKSKYEAEEKTLILEILKNFSDFHKEFRKDFLESSKNKMVTFYDRIKRMKEIMNKNNRLKETFKYWLEEMKKDKASNETIEVILEILDPEEFKKIKKEEKKDIQEIKNAQEAGLIEKDTAKKLIKEVKKNTDKKEEAAAEKKTEEVITVIHFIDKFKNYTLSEGEYEALQGYLQDKGNLELFKNSIGFLYPNEDLGIVLKNIAENKDSYIELLEKMKKHKIEDFFNQLNHIQNDQERRALKEKFLKDYVKYQKDIVAAYENFQNVEVFISKMKTFSLSGNDYDSFKKLAEDKRVFTLLKAAFKQYLASFVKGQNIEDLLNALKDEKAEFLKFFTTIKNTIVNQFFQAIKTMSLAQMDAFLKQSMAQYPGYQADFTKVYDYLKNIIKKNEIDAANKKKAMQALALKAASLKAASLKAASYKNPSSPSLNVRKSRSSSSMNYGGVSGSRGFSSKGFSMPKYNQMSGRSMARPSFQGSSAYKRRPLQKTSAKKYPMKLTNSLGRKNSYTLSKNRNQNFSKINSSMGDYLRLGDYLRSLFAKQLIADYFPMLKNFAIKEEPPKESLFSSLSAKDFSSYSPLYAQLKL